MYIDVKIVGTSKIVRICGLGWTPEGALKSLKDSLAKRNALLMDRYGMHIDVTLPFTQKIPDHCIATSNLPWWKRLFRV